MKTHPIDTMITVEVATSTGTKLMKCRALPLRRSQGLYYSYRNWGNSALISNHFKVLKDFDFVMFHMNLMAELAVDADDFGEEGCVYTSTYMQTLAERLQSEGLAEETDRVELYLPLEGLGDTLNASGVSFHFDLNNDTDYVIARGLPTDDALQPFAVDNSTGSPDKPYEWLDPGDTFYTGDTLFDQEQRYAYRALAGFSIRKIAIEVCERLVSERPGGFTYSDYTAALHQMLTERQLAKFLPDPKEYLLPAQGHEFPFRHAETAEVLPVERMEDFLDTYTYYAGAASEHPPSP